MMLLMLVGSLSYAQNQTGQICRLGFDWEISLSTNWGLGKPVVVNVFPYTPAELAGIKLNDVIDAIDGVSVLDVSIDEIAQMLNPAGKNEVVLSIRNLNSDIRQVVVRKECKKPHAISEDQLAIAYSMYSLESTVEREFICPFNTVVTSDAIDFTHFKSYGFSAVDQNNVKLESAINDKISIELSRKGMVLNAVNPDMLVQTYYYFDHNPNFKGSSKVQIKKEPIYRFNIAKREFELFPFLSYNTAESEAPYLLQLGIRFIDQVDYPGRILWECEANELLDASFNLGDYAQIHIPLMLMQYPYVKYIRNVPYRITKKIYNYTGIQYDIDRLELVADVDRNSPAYAAGIRPNDVVEKIGRHKMNRTPEEFTAAYKRFITQSMKYRDPKTIFTDANGFERCMYWDTFHYPKIAETLQKSEYLSAFSYIYHFAPYINPTGSNTCTFEVKRGKSKQEIIIRPTIRTELTIEIK